MLTARTYQEAAAANKTPLEIDLPSQLPPVKIYEEYLSNALGRLISNSIKFSHATQKPIKITASTSAEWVDIAVIDQGIGITPENLKQIFKRFRQINREKMEQQGIGMGLYITRSLVEIHGGDLDAVSEPGEGSTFTIHLPIVKEL